MCGAHVELTDPTPWRCPRATLTDRHHVLHAIAAGREIERGATAGGESNPFLRHDPRLAWAAAAAARGMTDDARAALVRETDDAIARVDGVGFVTTPFGRDDVISDALGFSADGGVWVKDETNGVGGSQKARHLMSILLHLRALETLGLLDERPPLAIASCGNAALAAATLASAVDWPIDVYVPTWMGDGFGRRLDELGARIHRCERSDGDPPGDPAMLRCREAVEAGAVPFTVQGPENALCLDGGRTIGWELAEQILAADGPQVVDAVFAQVGGGAFAACLSGGLAEAGLDVPLRAVQVEGCAPLERAVRRSDGVEDPAGQWSTIMTPWDDPHSLADGILDDETYDWVAVLDRLRESGGDVVVVDEDSIVRAHELAESAGFAVSPTGAAGLAGLVRLGGAAGRGVGGSDPSSGFDADDRVAVVMSGVRR